MISLSQISMRFGGKILFEDVSLQLNLGNRYGLIGANGSGKSTLIKILIGELTAEKGSIAMSQRAVLGSLAQDHYKHKNQIILDIVIQGRQKLWEALEKKKVLINEEGFDEDSCDQLMRIEHAIGENEGYSAEGEAAKLLEGLGIRDDCHKKTIETLSGGYKLRVLLAQVLFGKPDILILDEPTNHLDLYSIRWLEEHLRNYPGTLLVSSHDKDFLNGICTHIADVDYGTIKIYSGNFEQFEKQKVMERELKEQRIQKTDKRKNDLQGFIDRFGSKATKARQAQSKARIVEKLEEEIKALDLVPSSRLYPHVNFEPLRPSGITVLTVHAISKVFGEKKVLHDVSFEIERGEKVAIIGPNGIGKSTLLEILTQHQKAYHGSYLWGHAVSWSYFPQDHAKEVHGSISLLDWLWQYDKNASQEQLRSLLGRVLFSGDTVNNSVSSLSGGEAARLLLAKIMLQKPNVLIFDEPTNHLDMEAIDQLAEALENFEGSLLFVSHNRHFVSRLADRVIEITKEGVKNFKGTYVDYLERQANDFLIANLPLSRRFAQEKNVSPLNQSIPSYEEQKRIKSRIAQLKKKASNCEDLCHRIEQQIQECDMIMASDGYYQTTPIEEQKKKVQEKLELEKKLEAAFTEWETLSLSLQREE